MAVAARTQSDLFQTHLALPQQHGSWVLWLAPYAVGISVGGHWSAALVWLTFSCLGAFLAMQPLTLWVKVLSGRRGRSDLRPAVFWFVCWTVLSAVGAAGLVMSGHWRVLLLGLPAFPVLAWELWLVAHRSERGQMGVELVAAGALTLAAPAGYQVTAGYGNTAWWLWVLCWLQSAASIVYIYLRLEHRRMNRVPKWPERLHLARRGLIYHVGNLGIVTLLGLEGLIPRLVMVPFLAMLLEFVYGGLVNPGIRVKPSQIGVRQIVVAAVFSALLVLAYRM